MMKTESRRRTVALTMVGGLALLLTACAGQTSAQASPTTAAAPTTVAGTTAATAPASAQTTAVSVQKVNANTASEAEIQQALEAAGVSSAARWAREVAEYRPYPTDDPSFAKLRQELAKYNPGPGVVDMIVSTLTL
jgi:DNA uptake protein ComE-like DNA-binding protein